MADWRSARSLIRLRAEIDVEWPHRSRISDGTIGDARHAATSSDHNPNSDGVVRALDITSIGIDAMAVAEHIAQLGRDGFTALQNHGYVIYNRRAAYASTGWVWTPYKGIDPHFSHLHVSVGRDPAQYDSAASWRIFEAHLPPTTNEGDPFTMGQYEAINTKLDDLKNAVLIDISEGDEVEENVKPTALLAKAAADQGAEALTELRDLATYLKGRDESLGAALTKIANALEAIQEQLDTADLAK